MKLIQWFFSKLLGAFLIAVAFTILLPYFFPEIYRQMQTQHALFWTWIISFILLSFASLLVAIIFGIYSFLIKRKARGVVID